MKVIQNKEKPVPSEVIAEAITKIGDAVKKLDAAGLNDHAIVLLLSNASGVGKTETKNVLWALRHLETIYLKKTK